MEVNSYMYPGTKFTSDGTLLPEVKRRIVIGWEVFGKSYNINNQNEKKVVLTNIFYL